MDYSLQMKFAEDLARALDDINSLAYYESLVQEYTPRFLRETLLKVIEMKNVRNKGAYFNKLVQINGKKCRVRHSFEKEMFD